MFHRRKMTKIDERIPTALKLIIKNYVISRLVFLVLVRTLLLSLVVVTIANNDPRIMQQQQELYWKKWRRRRGRKFFSKKMNMSRAREQRWIEAEGRRKKGSRPSSISRLEKKTRRMCSLFRFGKCWQQSLTDLSRTLISNLFSCSRLKCLRIVSFINRAFHVVMRRALPAFDAMNFDFISKDEKLFRHASSRRDLYLFLKCFQTLIASYLRIFFRKVENAESRLHQLFLIQLEKLHGIISRTSGTQFGKLS